MADDKVKILMALHGIWPIPIHDNFDPIELEGGISLVSIIEKEYPSVIETPDDLVVKLHKKGTIELHPPHQDFPVSKLPRMGMLFEIQDKEKDGLSYGSNNYAVASMRPKTILRLFKTGEFITSLIINPFGFDIYTPISDDPDLLYYEIESKDIEPMKLSYKYLSEKWKMMDKLLASYKGSLTMKRLFNRLNNAIQFLPSSRTKLNT